MYVAHVGDSRCYRVRNGEITQLTRDHSLLNDYLAVLPDLTPEQREELPKNVITRALGMQDSVVVDLVPETPKPGDLYMLCSDGLSGMITDEDILAICIANVDDPQKAATEMVAKANVNGGEDNITVVVLGVRI
jgi:protein phosphatase